MSNIVLKLCREIYGHSISTLATVLEISPDQYTQLESGKSFTTLKQCQILGAFYAIDHINFQESTELLGLLASRKEIISSKAIEISRLELEVRKLEKHVRSISKKTEQSTDSSTHP